MTNTYFKEVEGQIYDVLSRYDSSWFKVTVRDFKAKLLRKLQANDRQKFKTQLVVRKFDSTLEE